MWCCWCLLQGDRDGGGEQIEGLPLRGGGEGDLVDLVAADGDGLAGEGGQVIEQVAEAAGWLAAGGGLRAALASAERERRAGATGLSRAGGCSSL